MNSRPNVTTTLGHLADLQVGFPFKSSGYSQSQSGTRLLRGDNIGPGFLRWDNPARWESTDVDSEYELRSGDIVLAMDRPWVSTGLKFARVGEPDLPAYLVQRVSRLRAREGVNQRYLQYVVASSEFTSYVLGVQTGTAVPHISGSQILSYRLAHRPSAEQRAIVEVLGALDDKIAVNDRVRGRVDELAAARLASLAKGRPHARLESIAEVNRAVAKLRAGGVVRYIDISSVGRGDYEYPKESRWEDAPSRARRILSRGDTIWSTVRPNRRSHALVLDDDPALIASTGLAVLTARHGLVAGLYEATRREEFASYLETVAEGSAYPAVRGDRFSEAPIPSLSLDEWEAFEAFARPLRARAHAATVENRVLVATRDEMLPLLMSGRLRVKDAERTVEEVV